MCPLEIHLTFVTLFSAFHQILTLEVPSAPRNLHLELFHHDPLQVQFSWQKPRTIPGTLKAYNLYWGRKGETYTVVQLVPTRHSYVSGFLGMNWVISISIIFIFLSDKGATYEFRILARNEEGDGMRASKTIKTPDGVPAGAPENFTVTGITGTSVLLEWDLPDKQLQNGEIMMYQLVYHKVADQTEVEDMNITELQTEINQLDMNTDYVFRIRAYTSQGAGPWTTRLDFHTFVLPPPENINITRYSPTSVQITWDDLKDPVSNYIIYYSMFDLNNLDLWNKKVIGPYTVAMLDKLEEQTIYVIKIQAQSIYGRYGHVSESHVTPLGPPGTYKNDVVKTFMVSVRKSKELTLIWDPPKKPQVVHYMLTYYGQKSYREHGSNKWQTSQTPLKELVVTGKSRFVTVKPLLPRTRYTFTITAKFLDGSTGPARSIMIQTRIEAPETVPIPILGSKEGTDIKLILQSARETNGFLSHYILVVIPLNRSGLEEKKPESFTVEDLTRDNGGPTLPAKLPYIAAKFPAYRLPSRFKLGDKQQYGGYTNRPLDRDMKYQVFLKAYTVDQNLYTNSKYLTVATFSTQVATFSTPVATFSTQKSTGGEIDSVLIISGCVIGVIGIVALSSCVLNHHKKRRRPRQTANTVNQGNTSRSSIDFHLQSEI